jgi:hypothetical protein
MFIVAPPAVEGKQVPGPPVDGIPAGVGKAERGGLCISASLRLDTFFTAETRRTLRRRREVFHLLQQQGT